MTFKINCIINMKINSEKKLSGEATHLSVRITTVGIFGYFSLSFFFLSLSKKFGCFV